MSEGAAWLADGNKNQERHEKRNHVIDAVRDLVRVVGSFLSERGGVSPEEGEAADQRDSEKATHGFAQLIGIDGVVRRIRRTPFRLLAYGSPLNGALRCCVWAAVI